MYVCNHSSKLTSFIERIMDFIFSVIFSGKRNIRALYLNSNNIISIQNGTFFGIGMLRALQLENNKMQKLERY